MSKRDPREGVRRPTFLASVAGAARPVRAHFTDARPGAGPSTPPRRLTPMPHEEAPEMRVARRLTPMNGTAAHGEAAHALAAMGERAVDAHAEGQAPVQLHATSAGSPPPDAAALTGVPDMSVFQDMLARHEQDMSELSHRIGGAVHLLRATAERLAADARADVLELALLVARRIVEAELTTNVEPLVGLIRNAIGRVGETRRVVVRLSPGEVETIGRAEAAGRFARQTLASAHVEIVADPTLARGDCVVEGDLVSVDGRLAPRFEEARRLLFASLEQDEG